MEPELRAGNGGMREQDDSLLVDFRPHLQAQILRAAERLHECRMVIRSQFAMNPYLHLMGPLRFELKLPTPQAGRIPSYPTVPHENGRISSMRSA